MAKLEQIASLKQHEGRVWNLAWHPTSPLLTSCGEDKTIRIWGKEGATKWSNKIILTDGHKRTIREVNWSPCGKYLASASFDTTTCIWDKESGEFECNATLEGHENEVKSVAWSQSGHFLATCSRDKSVWIWEIAGEDEYDCAAVLNAHTQDVKKVVWHPTADVLASASYDNTIKLFKEDPSDHDWLCFATLAGHESTVWSLAWSADGGRLASCGDDRTVRIWREYRPGNAEGVATSDGDSAWKCVCTLSGHHTRTVYDVSWGANGLLATAGGDDAIRIFREDEGADANAPNFSQIVCVERAHEQDVNCVRWHPEDGALLASCSDDGQVKLWHFGE